jgi:PAS domain S-box-containing protein
MDRLEAAGARRAMEAAMDGVAVLDDEGRYVYVNREHARLYGYDEPSAMEGESWRSVYGDEERARFESEVMPEVAATGGWRGEAVGRRVDGSEFHQELSLSRLDDGGLVCIARDVTDRKRRERQLRLLHEAGDALMHTTDATALARLAVDIAEEVLDHPLTAYWSHDPADDRLRPLAATEAMATLGGFDDADDLPTLGPDSFEWSAFAAGESRLVADYRTVDGAVEAAPLRTVLLLPVGDHGLLVVGSTAVTDVADPERYLLEMFVRHLAEAFDRTRREHRLEERRTELERQNERLEEFAGTVAHDLRNPLTVARAQLDVARDSGDDDHLDAVESAHERMTQMISELLSLARRGQAVVDPDPVALDEVVARAWRHVDTGAATLVTDIDPGTSVTADEGRLAELFENLFRNSVEHGSTGSRTTDRSDRADDAPTVTVGTLPGDGGFYVEDDGPGVPPDERDAVFEAGYTDAPDGTGFGLSIVRQIVDGHGWDLTLTAGAAGGARFEVRT